VDVGYGSPFAPAFIDLSGYLLRRERHIGVHLPSRDIPRGSDCENYLVAHPFHLIFLPPLVQDGGKIVKKAVSTFYNELFRRSTKKRATFLDTEARAFSDAVSPSGTPFTSIREHAWTSVVTRCSPSESDPSEQPAAMTDATELCRAQDWEGLGASIERAHLPTKSGAMPCLFARRYPLCHT